MHVHAHLPPLVRTNGEAHNPDKAPPQPQRQTKYTAFKESYRKRPFSAAIGIYVRLTVGVTGARSCEAPAFQHANVAAAGVFLEYRVGRLDAVLCSVAGWDGGRDRISVRQPTGAPCFLVLDEQARGCGINCASVIPPL